MSDTQGPLRRVQLLAAGYTPLDIVCNERGVDWRAGGTAANVAAILAYFGWRTAVAGQTGADVAGRILISDLASAGVRTDCLSQVEGANAARLVHQIADGHHEFRFKCPRCEQALPRNRPLNRDGAECCTKTFEDPRFFFFDRATAATVELAEAYAKRGSLVMYEPSIPANAELLRRAVEVATIVKHSDDRTVGGIDDLRVSPPPQQLRIVTHGSEGLDLRYGDLPAHRLPAISAEVVDAGGAGDWTTAGLLYKLGKLPNLSVERVTEAVRFGQALGALSCTGSGARGLMRLKHRTVLRAASQLVREPEKVAKSRSKAFSSRRLKVPRGMCPMCVLPLADGKESSEPPARRQATRVGSLS